MRFDPRSRPARSGQTTLHHGANARRRGITLVEIIVATLLLGIVFAGSVPAVVWVVRCQRSLERRQAALLEASNVLEQLTLRRRDALPEGQLSDLPPLSGYVGDFPALRVSAAVVAQADPAARRITVEIHWEDAPGRPNRPVILHGWVFPESGASP